MNERSVCPNCGKTLEETMRFCPFCGTALCGAVTQEDEAQGRDNPAARVRARYEAYSEWVVFALNNGEFGRVLAAMFTGNRAFKNSPEHERFLVDIQQLGTELEHDYRTGKARETLQALLRFVLIDCYRDAPSESEWMFMAAEKSFLPLVELLTQEEAASLYPAYRVLRKKNPGFEIQKAIRKQLKKISGD